MKIDRTPKPCHHKQANHQHGTPACYKLDRCRCYPCAYARSAETDRATRATIAGNARMVDADPVRAHVRALLAAGWGTRSLADHARVSRSSVRGLLHPDSRGDGTYRPPSERVERRTAEALLAVPLPGPSDLTDGARVDATGARRRLRALCALGWSVSRLEREHGLERQVVDRLLAGELDRVTARTHRAVVEVFDRIGDREPAPVGAGEARGVTMARRRAAACGWAVPAAWDEDALDDPGAPEPGRLDEVRRKRPVVDLDEFLHLVEGGVTVRDAAARLGVAVASVEDAAARAGREDVLRRARPGRMLADRGRMRRAREAG